MLTTAGDRDRKWQGVRPQLLKSIHMTSQAEIRATRMGHSAALGVSLGGAANTARKFRACAPA